MKHNEGNFGGANNSNLFYQSWQPDNEVKAQGCPRRALPSYFRHRNEASAAKVQTFRKFAD